MPKKIQAGTFHSSATRLWNKTEPSLRDTLSQKRFLGTSKGNKVHCLRKKNQWRHQNYVIMLKIKEILTQEHQYRAKNIPVMPRFSRLRRSPIAWSRSGQNYIIRRNGKKVVVSISSSMKSFKWLLISWLKERYVCTDLLRLCTKHHYSGDQECELETLSRMTIRPTVDDDFCFSLTSFFPLFKIEWGRRF